MFGIDSIELLIVAIAALVFIGPKELPGTLRTVGRFVGKMRGYARHFNAGIEQVMREAELEAMEKEWREQNERIMAQFPDADAPMMKEDAAGQTALPLDEAQPEDDKPVEDRELP